MDINYPLLTSVPAHELRPGDLFLYNGGQDAVVRVVPDRAFVVVITEFGSRRHRRDTILTVAR